MGKQRPNPRMISRLSATSSDPAQPQERKGPSPRSCAGVAARFSHKKKGWGENLGSPGSQKRTGVQREREKRRCPGRPMEGRSASALQPSSRLSRSAARIPLRLGSSRSLARPGSRGKRQPGADWPSGMQVPGGRRGGGRGGTRRRRRRMLQMDQPSGLWPEWAPRG